MKETKKYLVSTYNETPYNDYYFTTNRLKADLLVSENIKNNKHGMLIEVITIKNTWNNTKKEVRNLLKEF